MAKRKYTRRKGLADYNYNDDNGTPSYKTDTGTGANPTDSNTNASAAPNMDGWLGKIALWGLAAFGGWTIFQKIK